MDAYCHHAARPSVRPSVRHFKHFNLFHVTEMHIKLDIQTIYD